MSTEPLPPDYSDYAPELYPRASLREIYFVLLKHRWPAIAVILGIWLFAFISKYTEIPNYRATALIQIDWGKINVVQDVMINPTRAYADVYGTQEKIVKSRQLAENVVEDLELWDHPLFAPDADVRIDHEKLVSRIGRSVQGMVKVTRVKKTQLMEVSFRVARPRALSSDGQCPRRAISTVQRPIRSQVSPATRAASSTRRSESSEAKSKKKNDSCATTAERIKS